MARPLQTTAYQALFTDSLGCKAEAEITVFVRRHEGIYVPNAFSPNEDGRNDRFAPYSDASVESVESFRIYNRWGALLFERTNFRPNDESLGWDGKVNGQPAPPGAYVYQLIARRLDGRTVPLEGEVMLMR
ncbi:MAG: gliding motility-associated C-terminal domain-containing protein [Phaeodactylibacter sp.]|nr:gliding motility-associated C-terminal domain-containing protein [Phaeodactylibacter sp.]